MNRFPAPRICLLTMLAAFSVLTVSSAAAQPTGLFSPLPSESTLLPSQQDSLAPGATSEPSASDLPRHVPWLGGETIRKRSAYIDLKYLAATRAKLGRDSTESVALILNLFPDVSFRATDLRVASTLSGYSLSGRLENFKFGTVTMAVSGNVVAGSIRTGKATYTIRSVSGDLVEIRLVDPTTLPKGAEPLTPSTPQARPPQASSTSVGEETVIDVLVVWTPSAREEVGGTVEIQTLIDLYVAEANQAYADSGVSLALNLLHSQEVDYVESDQGLFTDLFRLSDPDAYLDEVRDLRDRVGADLVQLVTGDGLGFCGVAWGWYRSRTADGDESLAPGDGSSYSIIRHNCHDLAMAHEFGHNGGLAHDRYLHADWPFKPYPYAHGYVNQSAFESSATESQRWITIMAYPDQCTDSGIWCGRVLRFSNPDQTHLGDPLGVAGEEETWSLDGPVDARRALNDTRELIAGHREERAVLGLRTWVSVVGLRADQNFSVEAEVRNQGRAKSDPVTLRVYRSKDAVISASDDELASVALGEVGPGHTGRESVELTAPSDGGNYYFGVCVESESAPRPCSASVEVSVGPTVSIAPATATEGENIAFAVALSSAQPEPVTVAWTLSSVTATEAVDYAAMETPPVTIPAGDTQALIYVPTLDDQLAEPDDVLAAALSHATVGDGRPFALSVDARTAEGTIADNDGDLSIPDPGLRMALRTALGKDPGEAIEESDLAALRQLDWSYAKRQETGAEWSDRISDLTGLEFATNLRRLNLSNNSPADLAPMAHLPNLSVLDLSSSNVGTVTPLAHLKNLRELSLQFNQISDIVPLGSLASLQKLQLADNRISVLSALSRLPDLEELWLSRNEIASVEHLRSLTNLRYVYLGGNPISSLTPLAGLSALQILHLNDTEIS